MGEHLKRLGYIDQFCTSNMCTEENGEVQFYCCELNLRYNGGTHFSLSLLHFTDGRYTDEGYVVGRDGKVKHTKYMNAISNENIVNADKTELIGKFRRHPML